MASVSILDNEALAAVAEGYPASVGQRVGWLLDFMAEADGPPALVERPSANAQVALGARRRRRAELAITLPPS